MSYRVLATYRLCLVCGDDLRPPQTALVAERDATPDDITDAIKNNEVCERCWTWAGTAANFDDEPMTGEELTA